MNYSCEHKAARRIIEPMKLSLLLMSICLLWVHPLSANEVVEESEATAGTFSLFFENDLFGGTDANYTNGIKFNWVSPDLTRYRDSGRIPSWALPMVKKLPFIHRSGLQRNVGLGIAQKIFTPRDTDASQLLEQDRPYAGWLYLSAAFHNKNLRRLDSMEVQLGVVGPAALGRQSQNGVHKIRGIEKANGWDNQLSNELGLVLVYEHKDRYIDRIKGTRLGADLITHYGVSLGNVFTYANAGVETRFGWNIPADFGTSLIRPGGEANAPVDSSDPWLSLEDRFSLYGFTALSARLVLRDIFLDGNSFADSHSVDKEYLIGDAIVGVGLTWDRWKLSYAQVFRSREFKQQPGHHNFGSISISFTL